jgi:hypothetical protein
MPQIWLTYDELAVLMDCDRWQARDAAASIPLDRRKSRDGQTRAKLTPPLIEAFFDKVLRQRLGQSVADCAADLWAMRDQMAARPGPRPHPRPDLHTPPMVGFLRSRAR